MDDVKVELTKSELENLVTTAIAKSMEDLKKDIVPLTNDKKDVVQDFAEFLKAVKNGDRNRIKAADPNVEGSDPAGGYLVPRVTAERILDVVGTYGQGRQLFQELPIGRTGKLRIPKYAGGVTRYWVGENQKINASKFQLNVIDVDTAKQVAMVVVSSELLEDAIVDVANFVIQKIGQAFGEGEDEAFFNNTSPFTGLFKVPLADFGAFVDHGATTPDPTYDELKSMIYKLDKRKLQGARWLMHRTWMDVIRSIKDTTGRPILFEPNDGSTPTLFGYPVELIEFAPSVPNELDNLPYIILGNPKNSYYGVKKEMNVQILTEATINGTNLAEYDLSAIKVTERVAFHPGLIETYVAWGYE